MAPHKLISKSVKPEIPELCFSCSGDYAIDFEDFGVKWSWLAADKNQIFNVEK